MFRQAIETLAEATAITLFACALLVGAMLYIGVIAS